MTEDNIYSNERNLLELIGKRIRGPKVASEFRKVYYSLTPLEIIIREEEIKALKDRAFELELFCMRHLSKEEYEFLKSQIRIPFIKLRMPLEFRQFDEDEFYDYLSDNLTKFKWRLQKLMDSVKLHGNGKINDKTLKNPYLFAGKNQIIQIYNSVRNYGGNYPYGFFSKYNKRVATILTRYLIDEIMHLPHERILPEVKKTTFINNKLGMVLDICYADVSSPVLTVIRDAYPEEKFPKLYSTNYRPEDPVKSLLDLLQSY